MVPVNQTEKHYQVLTGDGVVGSPLNRVLGRAVNDPVGI